MDEVSGDRGTEAARGRAVYRRSWIDDVEHLVIAR